MTTYLGIDTGGTYTDAVLFDKEHGVLASAKALTTKYDLAVGIRDAIEAVLPVSGKSHPAISLVSVSTTLATNALVEGHGTPICLLLLGYPAEFAQPGRLGQSPWARPGGLPAGRAHHHRRRAGPARPGGC